MHQVPRAAGRSTDDSGSRKVRGMNEAASESRNSPTLPKLTPSRTQVRLGSGQLRRSRDAEVMDPTNARSRANARSRVFWTLHDAIAANGHSPTVRELAELVGLTAGTVHYHLKALKRDRWIDWPAGKARSITILRVPAAQPSRPAFSPTNGPHGSG
jgi:hypothetical protein